MNLSLNWSGLDDFAAMGGHAFPVWGSVGMVALFVAVEIVSLRRRRRAALQALAADAASTRAARP
jgi:heme exporter protein CcmD